MKRKLAGILAVALLLSGCVAAPGPQGGEEMTTESKQQVTLEYHSFDGGGPSFRVQIDDPAILEYRSEEEYDKANHEELDGAGYTVRFVFTGKQPGQTRVTVTAESPIGDNYTEFYDAAVDADGKLTLELRERVTPEDDELVTEPEQTERDVMLVLEVNGATLYASFVRNAASDALIEQLNSGPVTLTLEDRIGEKFAALPWTLPTADDVLDVAPGDLVLYGGEELAICCAEGMCEATRLAQLGESARDALPELLGDGAAELTIWLEWGE